MTQADTAIAYELAQVGKPYQWGATGPNTYDCSGLQVAGWRAAGVSLPRTSYQMMSVGRAVPSSALAPGDLVFPHPGHVQMYLGNGYVVEAPHTGAEVQVVPVGSVYAARRVSAIPGSPAVTHDTTGQLHIEATGGIAGTGIPNPLNVPGDIASAVLSAIYNGLFKPFVADATKYVWRIGMVLLGGILILFAIWQWKPVQRAASGVKSAASTVVEATA